MKLTKNQYKKKVEKAAPPSKIVKNCIKAFIAGGLICVLGQGITNIGKSCGLGEKEAGAVTAMALVFLGALLTGLNIYSKIAKHAGAGTLVPITGFANSIVAPALEFKKEGYIMGTGAKMFTIAGPVLVFGISASIIYGLILYLFNLA